MTWKIKLSSKAEKYYGRLGKDTRKRIRKSLSELSWRGNPADHSNVRPLTGELKGFYRLRVGNYRIIFAILRDERTVAVVNVTPRGDAYKP